MLFGALKLLINQCAVPKTVVHNVYSIIMSPTIPFAVDFSLTFDSVTIIVINVVIIIAALVHLYSFQYMKGDAGYTLFLAYLHLFVFSMLLFVTAGNLILLFVGWELVGFCSFLLINHWYSRFQANKAGLKAILINRIGDIALLFGLILCWSLFGTIDLQKINALTPHVANIIIHFDGFKFHGLTTIGFLFFFAAMAKSAQIILHTWLPDAMEGPTPVSALLHAATMVTAGIILLIRVSYILEFSSAILHSCMIVIGAITACFGASSALFQYDLKRIIAYSTCSQLGLMIIAIGLSDYQLALYHFYNHAFFKALLFLSAGVIIHGLNGEQDIRYMGGLVEVFPLSYTCFFIGSYSLMGLPYSSGYYS